MDILAPLLVCVLGMTVLVWICWPQKKSDDQWKADLQYCSDLYANDDMRMALMKKLLPEVISELSAKQIYQDEVRKKLGIIYHWDPDIGRDSPHPYITQLLHIPDRLIDLAATDSKIAHQLGSVIGAILPPDVVEIQGDSEEPLKILYYIQKVASRLDQSDQDGLPVSIGRVFVTGINGNNPAFCLVWITFSPDYVETVWA